MADKKIFIFGIGGFGSSRAPVKLPMPVAAKINNLINTNARILVGDCRGVDTLVQEYLKAKGYKNVCVYYSGRLWRNKIDPAWDDKNIDPGDCTGRSFYTAKDIEACRDADEGIAVWDGLSTGTGRNISQLESEGKPCAVYRLDKNTFDA